MSFYSFLPQAEGGENAPAQLMICGEIAPDGWGWDGDTEAERFRAQLSACGDVDVVINSPGGDVFAGAAIYAYLRAHPGRVVVKIAGIAASIASLIAMAGDEILISRAGYLMIHRPWMHACGDAEDMERYARQLREIGAGIAAAYAEKTGMTREEISALLDAETYMNAESALEMGFADGLWETPRLPESPAACMRGRDYYPAAYSARMRKGGKTQAIADLMRRGMGPDKATAATGITNAEIPCCDIGPDKLAVTAEACTPIAAEAGRLAREARQRAAALADALKIT